MQDLIYRTAGTQNYSMNIVGGNDKTKYSISGNYLDQQGTIINSGYKRYQGTMTLDQVISSKLKVGVSTSYTFTQQSGISPSFIASVGGNPTSSLMFNILGFRPYVDAKDPNAINNLVDPGIGTYAFNPYINQQHLLRTNGATTLMANGYAEYAITPKLKFKSTIGINYVNTSNIAFNDSLTSYGSPLTAVGQSGPNGSVTSGIQSNWVNENTLIYNTSINKAHNFSVLVGESEQAFTYSGYTVGNYGLSSPGLGIAGIAQGNSATSATVGESSTTYSKVSLFGRLMYNYKSKYFLSGTLRRDASSRFLEDNRWGTFPAVSAKWNIDAESFWKQVKPVVSTAALRLSYGAVGNDLVPGGNFPTVTQYATTVSSGATGGGYTILTQPNSFSQIAGVYVPTSSPGNPGIQWESQKSYNLGLDLGFLKNRINLTVEAYNKTSDKLIYASPIPSSTGFKLLNQNIAKIRNQGLEFTLNTTNITNRNFTWTTSFNIAFNANKVLDLANYVDAQINTINYGTSSQAYILKKGQPLGLFYGLIWQGNYQYSDFTQNAAGQYILKDNVPSNQTTRNTGPTLAPQPGDIKYKDINGDGVINASDQTAIGRGYPIHIGGFGNNFTYKGFDLNIFFQWSYGNQIQNANRTVFESNATGTNQFESVKNRWTPQNQNNVMFRAGGGAPQGQAFLSTRTLEDGSYLRLKTLNLGYSLPKTILDKWKVKQVRIYVSAQNLITWTKYTGYDPEVSTYSTLLTPGFDWGAYPRAKTMTVGANFTF